jgi:hypothetical protein
MKSLNDEKSVLRALVEEHRTLNAYLYWVVTHTTEKQLDDFIGTFSYGGAFTVGSYGTASRKTRVAMDGVASSLFRIVALHKLLAVFMAMGKGGVGEKELSILAPQLTRTLRESVAPGPWSNLPTADQWVRDIINCCLYVDAVWIPDPALMLLARDTLIGLTPGQKPSQQHLRAIFAASQAVDTLAPLIEEGIVRLYYPVELYTGAVAIPLLGDIRWPTPEEIDSAWPEGFVAEGVATARALHAGYASLDATEARSLDQATAEIATAAPRLGALDTRVISALLRGRLPAFSAVSPSILMRVRQDSEGFADFRAELRQVVRTMLVGVESPDFLQDLRDLDRDVLQPSLNRLAAEARGTISLRQFLRDAAIDVSAGVIAAQSLLGRPLEGAALGGLTALSKVMLRILFEAPAPRPAAHVVLKLTRSGEKR